MRKACAVLGALLLCAAPALAAEETVHYGRFGPVVLYSRAPVPSRVVLFISGDGGWNLGVVDMARELAGLDALVVGIDITRYLKNLAQGDGACSYPAADFEALSKFVQKRRGFPRYVPPVLVGYSSGATLVYAVLVQAPAGTFQGGVSLGFCPDLQLAKPLCRGAGGLAWKGPDSKHTYWFGPSAGLATPWIALQGTIDQVCEPAATEAYVRKVGRASIVLLPKVGHGFSVPRNWMPQFREAFARLVAAAEPAASPAPLASAEPKEMTRASVAGLPLVEVPSADPGDTLALMVSGDGGWAGLDRELAAVLARRGVPVVGLDTLQYFWSAKSPDAAAADAERILRHYLAAWRREKVLLIGYSFGADVLPFIASRLPGDLAARVRLVALLGPARSAQFEFHILEWVSDRGGKDDLPVLPEIGKLGALRVLCLDAQETRDSPCASLAPGQGRAVTLKGGHHFGGDYAGIAEIILSELK
ncbi:MAG TPA: AcvB/VirJ family lysyl-phosphatidylglycerol hydrolase [bacterium]